VGPAAKGDEEAMKYPEDFIGNIVVGDSLSILREIPDGVVNCCVTSPPYWGLRDYGNDGQMGLDKTPEEYVKNMTALFREVRRVLRDDGTLWLNLGDSYNGSGPSGGQGKQYTNKGSQGTVTKNVDGLKTKDLCGIPWRVAFALQSDGWYLRSDIIWSKPNPMPESVTDRPTKAHEYIFLMAKSQTYYYDAEAIKEPAVTGFNGSHFDTGKTAVHQLGRTQDGERFDDGLRNKRSVWEVPTKPFPEAHFATFPPDLIKPCILAGCPEGGVVLDPFGGAGTTGLVAATYGRDFVLCELNPKYAEMARKRVSGEVAQGKLFT